MAVYTIGYTVGLPATGTGPLGVEVLGGAATGGGRYIVSTSAAGATHVTLNILDDGPQSAEAMPPLSGGLLPVTLTLTLVRPHTPESSAGFTDVVNTFTVPEPGAWAMLGVGAALLLWRARRGRRRPLV